MSGSSSSARRKSVPPAFFKSLAGLYSTLGVASRVLGTVRDAALSARATLASKSAELAHTCEGLSEPPDQPVQGPRSTISGAPGDRALGLSATGVCHRLGESSRAIREQIVRIRESVKGLEELRQEIVGREEELRGTIATTGEEALVQARALIERRDSLGSEDDAGLLSSVTSFLHCSALARRAAEGAGWLEGLRAGVDRLEALESSAPPADEASWEAELAASPGEERLREILGDVELASSKAEAWAMEVHDAVEPGGSSLLTTLEAYERESVRELRSLAESGVGAGDGSLWISIAFHEADRLIFDSEQG